MICIFCLHQYLIIKYLYLLFIPIFNHKIFKTFSWILSLMFLFIDTVNERIKNLEWEKNVRTSRWWKWVPYFNQVSRKNYFTAVLFLVSVLFRFAVVVIVVVIAACLLSVGGCIYSYYFCLIFCTFLLCFIILVIYSLFSFHFLFHSSKLQTC